MTRAFPDWAPRSLQALSAGYTFELFVADLIAGVTGAGRHPVPRRLEHGRMARDRRDLQGLRKKGRALVICGAPSQPAGAMRKAEFHERLGEANICKTVQDALDRAAEIVKAP